MKYKVVQTEKGKVLVDESAKLLNGDWHIEKELIINQFPNYLTDLDACKKITATINFSIDKDVPMVIVKDDIDLGRLAKKEYLRRLDNCENRDFKDSLFFGHKAAKQKDVYSEEDIMKAMKYASELTNNKLKYMTDYIQSLNQEYIELETRKILKNKCIKCGLNLIESEGSTPICNEYECLGIVLATKTLEEFSNEEKIKTNIVDGQLIAYVKK